MDHMHMGYNDILQMPTIERKYHLNKLVQKKLEYDQRVKHSQGRGKGERKTTIGGDMLKQQMVNGTIPFQ